MDIIKLNSENFRKEVLEADKPVIVDFWGGWCSGCRAIESDIKKLNEEAGDRYIVAAVDVDVNADLIIEYRIKSIPTIFIFNHGEVIKKYIGTIGDEEFKNIHTIIEALYAN